MPQSINIQQNQNLLDICLQTTGSLDGLFDLAMANNLSITDELQAGQTIVVPDTIATNQDILNYYNSYGVKPATGITSAEVLELIDTTQDNACGEYTFEYSDEYNRCEEEGVQTPPIVYDESYSDEYSQF